MLIMIPAFCIRRCPMDCYKIGGIEFVWKSGNYNLKKDLFMGRFQENINFRLHVIGLNVTSVI